MCIVDLVVQAIMAVSVVCLLKRCNVNVMNNIPELTSLVWIKYCLYSFADVYLLLNTKRVNDKR